MREAAQATNAPELRRGVGEIAHTPHFMGHAKRLSKVDDFRGVLAVASQWIIMTIAASAAIWSNSWAVYAIAVVVIASRQHALGMLMHDASHYRLLSNRKLNEIVGNLFCALPVGMTVARYRADHKKHHKGPNKDTDPYFAIFKLTPRLWDWPKPWRAACGVLVGDVSGLHVFKMMRETAHWGPWKNHFSLRPDPPPLSRAERLTAYGFVFGVVGSLAAFGGWFWFFLLWALPSATIAPFLIRIRALSEHFGLPNDGSEPTRHVDGAWYERWAFGPLNSNHHLTHHLFPTIPWYNLPEMTRLLFENPEFSKAAHRSRTYFGMVRDELISDRPA